MKVVETRMTEDGVIKFTLTPQFLFVLAKDMDRAVHIIDGLKHFDEKQWREAVRVFMIIGLQKAHDDINKGKESTECMG